MNTLKMILSMFQQIKISTKNLIYSEAQARTIMHAPHIILGLSGGPDSVFLFHILKALHHEGIIMLQAAHLDHGWRHDSSKDVDFCQQLCTNSSIPFTAAHAKNLELPLKFNGSLEEIGRKLRRHFFEKILLELNADFISLAHHQQDQQETFFLRMLRGSSLAGLRCMDTREGHYLRPLLHVNKQTMLNYLHNNNINYLQDPTNNSDDYLRNKIRKYVLPALQACDKRFDQKFENTLHHLKNEDNLLKDLTQQAFGNIFKPTLESTTQATFFHGSLTLFRALDQHIQKRLIIYWLVKEHVKFNVSTSFIDEIATFLKHPHGGNHQLSSQWTLFKKKDTFGIVKN